MYVPIKLMEQQFPVVPMTILMVEIRRRRAPACCGGTPPALPLLLCPCVPTKQNGKQGSEQRHRQGGHWAVAVRLFVHDECHGNPCPCESTAWTSFLFIF
jgi:hypothetical protein